MSTNTRVDWAELAPQLVNVAQQDRAWYLTLARVPAPPGASTSAYGPDSR